MMRYFNLKTVPTTEYSYYSSEIYSVQKRTEDRTSWWIINYDTMYPCKEWTVDDAIKHYCSEEGRRERDESFRKAYGFYD